MRHSVTLPERGVRCGSISVPDLKGLKYIIILIVMCGACRRHTDSVSVPDTIVVSVGDSVLTARDLLLMIPSNLDKEDSLEMLKAVIDAWVEDKIIYDVAQRNISGLDEIDRMVRSYRNQLIIDRYIREMEQGGIPKIRESEIEAYYEANRGQLVTGQPLIKGIYIKVAENDENLDKIRAWLKDGSTESVDNIENKGMRQAVQYEYFNDRWLDWSDIAELIPYRFTDADEFLKSQHDFETEYKGMVYLLHISDFLHTGSEMPYAYAKPLIEDILRRGTGQAYRSQLLRSLYKRAEEDGSLKIGSYDPIRREFVADGKRDGK